MDRRSFLIACASASGGGLLSTSLAERAARSDDYTPPHVFPDPPPLRRITAVRLADVSWDEQALLSAFQGLVNRKDPRVYFLESDNDRQWLEYYKATYGVEVETVASIDVLFEKFAGEIDGYIVYDDTMLDSANVATTLGALRNAVPVSASLAPKLAALGLREIDNLHARWADRYEAYEWALQELMPHCSRTLLGSACVDRPHWPSRSIWTRDYFIAHKAFMFDLSACPRDRQDVDLLHRICAAINPPGCVSGWRCVRSTEQDFVQLLAGHGLFVLCGLHTLNLTIHTAVPKSREPFVQKHVTVAEVGAVERKVYISFMNTDGDSLYSMLRLQSGHFDEEEHGSMPYTWGFLPIAYDLMPGVARRHYEMKTENDYFAASTSGAAYTYPHLQADPEAYLRMSRYYLNKSDLRVAYLGNWDRDHWWQEVDKPELIELARRELPECIGFVRGMGESAFERQYLGGGAPYVFCGEGIHHDSDIYQTITDFVAAVPTRPLFLFCLVNHTNSLKRMKEAVDQFPKDDYRIVRLDEFLLLAQKASDTGLIPCDDFYPRKQGLQALLRKEAAGEWPRLYTRIVAHAKRATLDETTFGSQVEDPLLRLILDRSATPPRDIVAFDAIRDSLDLTRVALNRASIYVNSMAKGVCDFARTYSDLKESRIITALWERWVSWQRQPIDAATAFALARRLGQLAEELDTLFSRDDTG